MRYHSFMIRKITKIGTTEFGKSGKPLEVLENLQEIEDEGDVYESIEDIWPDYPSKDDFLWNDDEY